MLIVFSDKAKDEQIEEVSALIRNEGLKPLYMPGIEKKVLGMIGDVRKLEKYNISALPYVTEVIRVMKPYKLAAREYRKKDTVIKIRNFRIGAEKFVVIAGPCAVESLEQIMITARGVAENGAGMLRGGAFKPRTSPYSFQGLKEEGLKFLKQASVESGLPIVTEVIRPDDVALVASYADMLQIGARNMQNFELLKEAGISGIPVLLKRGMSNTIDEFLMAAEYIMSEGNTNVIMCERGIKTFENYTRNTLDLSAVPILKEKTHLPVIIDPSHATGHKNLVLPMSRAAAACGADGLIVEVHNEPMKALSDPNQQLDIDEFSLLMKDLRAVVQAVGRTL
ncbi:MAG: 3-deoxy-7-phosphoheptulonate synthase [Candidatus Muiribacteriaceae bacterium]